MPSSFLSLNSASPLSASQSTLPSVRSPSRVPKKEHQALTRLPPRPLSESNSRGRGGVLCRNPLPFGSRLFPSSFPTRAADDNVKPLETPVTLQSLISTPHSLVQHTDPPKAAWASSCLSSDAFHARWRTPSTTETIHSTEGEQRRGRTWTQLSSTPSLVRVDDGCKSPTIEKSSASFSFLSDSAHDETCSSSWPYWSPPAAAAASMIWFPAEATTSVDPPTDAERAPPTEGEDEKLYQLKGIQDLKGYLPSWLAESPTLPSRTGRSPSLTLLTNEAAPFLPSEATEKHLQMKSSSHPHAIFNPFLPCLTFAVVHPTSNVSREEEPLEVEKEALNGRQRKPFLKRTSRRSTSGPPLVSPSVTSPAGSSLSATATPLGGLDHKKMHLYKTEMCRSFEETGTCKYGERCHFAHTVRELRQIQRHQKYKTEICKTYWEKGSCPYGKRCCFIHSEPPATKLTESNGTRLVQIRPVSSRLSQWQKQQRYAE